MIKDLYFKKKLAGTWFNQLQQTICYEFQKIEVDYAKRKMKKSIHFEKKTWQKSKLKNEGGGIFSIMKNGLIFDSVGVNFSEVSGKGLEKMEKEGIEVIIDVLGKEFYLR